MARVKPLVLSYKNASDLEKAKADYDFIGRETETNWDKLELTVLTLPKKYKKKTERDAKAKARRDNGNYDDFSS